MLPPPAGEEEEKVSSLSGTQREMKAEGWPLQLLPIAPKKQPEKRKGEKLPAFANSKTSPEERWQLKGRADNTEYFVRDCNKCQQH